MAFIPVLLLLDSAVKRLQLVKLLAHSTDGPETRQAHYGAGGVGLREVPAYGTFMGPMPSRSISSTTGPPCASAHSSAAGNSALVGTRLAATPIEAASPTKSTGCRSTAMCLPSKRLSWILRRTP